MIYGRMLRFIYCENQQRSLGKAKTKKNGHEASRIQPLLFVIKIHCSLENMSKFLWFYDAKFVGEMGDSVNTHGCPSTQPSRPAHNRASRSTQPGTDARLCDTILGNMAAADGGWF